MANPWGEQPDRDKLLGLLVAMPTEILYDIPRLATTPRLVHKYQGLCLLIMGSRARQSQIARSFWMSLQG